MIASTDEVCVTAVAIAEFFSGLVPEERPVWRRFLESLRYLQITRDAARRAGEDRYDFARRGQTLSTPDALIAAAAREHQAIVVTDNVSDYPQSDIQVLALNA